MTVSSLRSYYCTLKTKYPQIKFMPRWFMPLCFTSTKSYTSLRLCLQGGVSIIISEILWDILDKSKILSSLSYLWFFFLLYHPKSWTPMKTSEVCEICPMFLWIHQLGIYSSYDSTWVDLSKWTDMSSFNNLIIFIMQTNMMFFS